MQPPSDAAHLPQQPSTGETATASIYTGAMGRMPYRGFWVRCAASVIDLVILAIPEVIALLTVPGARTCGSARGMQGSLQLSAGVCSTSSLGRAVAVFIVLLYFTYGWSTGGTPGQHALGILVVDADTGRRISLFQSALRCLGFVLASLPLGLGLLSAAWDPRRQGWHDKIARTLTVTR